VAPARRCPRSWAAGHPRYREAPRHLLAAGCRLAASLPEASQDSAADRVVWCPPTQAGDLPRIPAVPRHRHPTAGWATRWAEWDATGTAAHRRWAAVGPAGRCRCTRAACLPRSRAAVRHPRQAVAATRSAGWGARDADSTAASWTRAVEQSDVMVRLAPSPAHTQARSPIANVPCTCPFCYAVRPLLGPLPLGGVLPAPAV
jgi:hypothetical protein